MVTYLISTNTNITYMRKQLFFYLLSGVVLQLSTTGLHAQDAQTGPNAAPERQGFKRPSMRILDEPVEPQPSVQESGNETLFPNKRKAEVNSDGDLQGPFILNDEPLDVFLRLLEKLCGRTILKASGIDDKQKFSFISERSVNRDEAVLAFKSMLMLRGIALIPINETYWKAVPNANVSSQIPEFLYCRARDLPPSQDFYTKFFELKVVKLADIEGQLKPYMSANNASSIQKFPKSNAILVTDTLINLQGLEELIEKVDVFTSNETVELIPIKNTSAQQIKERLTALKLDMLNDARVDVDTRSNKLILIASTPVMEKIKNRVIELVSSLDEETDPLLKSEVIYIRHGEAAKVVEVINQIITGQKKSDSKDKKSENSALPVQRQGISTTKPEAAANTKAVPPVLPESGPAQSSQAETSEISGVEFSEYVQIVSEERSNAVVIYGTPMDIKQIKGIIDKLDIVLMQVKIDVIITEVSLSSDQVSGLSSFGLSYGTEDASGFSGNTQTYKLTDSSSPAFSITATESSFSAIFDVARQNQNVKVLSSPTIVTTHNKEGEVNISQSVPVITSSMNDISSVTTTRSSVDYKDIGIKLLVKPLVGKDGAIQLDIDQSVDSISGYTTIDNNQQPLISKRRAKSFVSVRSDEVIVMAGLQQIDTAEMDGGVWLLGDIPLLGELFKPEKNESKRRELIIFIRPSIIESQSAEDAIAGQAVDRSKVKIELTNFMRDGDFYPNDELEKKREDFERNRPYNKAVNTPVKFIRGIRR